MRIHILYTKTKLKVLLNYFYKLKKKIIIKLKYFFIINFEIYLNPFACFFKYICQQYKKKIFFSKQFHYNRYIYIYLNKKMINLYHKICHLVFFCCCYRTFNPFTSWGFHFPSLEFHIFARGEIRLLLLALNCVAKTIIE